MALAVLAFAALLAAPGGRPAAAPAGDCVGPAPEAVRPDFEAEVIRLVNLRRRGAGLAPLKQVESLSSPARWFARDMASDDYFEGHDSYDRRGGRLVRRCSWRTRVRSYEPKWSSLAENIAAGHETPAEVVDGWLHSPRHKANLLGGGYWETGAGFWAGGSQGFYWVQDFGRRPGVFPLVIDDEAPRTQDPEVRLYVYGKWKEMRLRNDDGAFTPWRRFSNELIWRLGEAAGTRSVSVELRSGTLRASASDTIELVAASATAGPRPRAGRGAEGRIGE
ncbi:MAG: CAP domain-containing protein [Vicinamibacterales bacterium]